MEIIFIILGIIVFGIVIASMVIFVRKGKNSKGSDFEKFVKQTANNLSAIDQVLSNFNDRLNELENNIFSQTQPDSKKNEEKYIQTKYYAYEQDGKIIIEVYKDNDVKVILPKQENGNKKNETENNNNNKKSETENKNNVDYKSMLLEKIKTPMTWQEIVALKIPNITQLVSQLKKEGLIMKNEKGLYILTQKEDKKS